MADEKFPIYCPTSGRAVFEGTAEQANEFYKLMNAYNPLAQQTEVVEVAEEEIVEAPVADNVTSIKPALEC